MYTETDLKITSSVVRYDGKKEDNEKPFSLKHTPALACANQLKDAETVAEFKARIFGDEIGDGKKVGDTMKPMLFLA